MKIHQNPTKSTKIHTDIRFASLQEPMCSMRDGLQDIDLVDGLVLVLVLIPSQRDLGLQIDAASCK